MKRYRLTDEAFKDLVKMTDKLGLDWFYPMYVDRKTISYGDLDDIMYSWECSWNKENTPELLTENIRKLFDECREWR